MGCFTTVILNGHDYQFKTGDDSCEVFKIGDSVPWRLDSQPGRGHLLDGAYPSHSGKSYPANHDFFWYDCFVIIRDHTIFDVAQRLQGESEEEAAERFGVDDDPKREWWTDKAWDIKRQIDEFYEKRRKPQRGHPMLRPLSEPIYDQETDPEVARLYELLFNESILGQNTER